MQAPREKLLDFIATFQPRGGIGGMAQAMVDGEGDEWLTDEQLRSAARLIIARKSFWTMAQVLTRRHRFRQKLNRENRRIAAAR